MNEAFTTLVNNAHLALCREYNVDPRLPEAERRRLIEQAQNEEWRNQLAEHYANKYPIGPQFGAEQTIRIGNSINRAVWEVEQLEYGSIPLSIPSERIQSIAEEIIRRDGPANLPGGHTVGEIEDLSLVGGWLNEL